MRVDGHLMVGTGLAFTDDLEGGLEHLENGIRCFESQRQRPRIASRSDRTRYRVLHDRGR